MGWFEKTQSFDELTTPLPRDEIIRRGRIALLDDETPEVLADLQAQGFSVDHLRSTTDPRFGHLATGLYHLLILDYGGIGVQYGPDEGLDVLRHLRRVNPALVVLAFSGRTFDASKSDFFRLCHAVLKKDSGIRETLETMEHHLGLALTTAHQWTSLLAVLQMQPESKDAAELEKKLRKAALSGTPTEKTRAVLQRFAPVAGTALAEALAGKVIEFGVQLLR